MINTKHLRGKLALIDCESMGIHGVTFAVSLILAEDLKETAAFSWVCTTTSDMGTPEDIAWVRSHVQIPTGAVLFDTPKEMRDSFWDKWIELRDQGYLLCSDVNWPVETSFLTACVNDHLKARNWLGPYPLLDLAMILSLGNPPTERLAGHMPEHNPLADIRHSLRQLAHVVGELNE